ncbi:hypothetical protein SVIO_102260 [Streptomyces violaceusniger]|uniref:Uncharacterized protein n=1 Tax=Streptomyces violaceusniger TaxID=68280 RepID=A0A4D4LNG6_STRVO|nr:hypothetical protein SVIO_102260 [Streptomyces violaceusniger]
MKAEYQKRERKAIRTSNATDRERVEKAVGTLRGFGTGEPKTPNSQIAPTAGPDTCAVASC